MTEPRFIIKDTSDDYLLKFELVNTNNSFANAIRRTCLSDVETLGFKTEPFEESNVNIIENTSSLHNEFLAHRIGMIPIYFQNLDSFDTSKYRFILEEQNKTSKTIDITTKNFKVLDLESNNQLDTDLFFPPNRNTGEYILITKLKPNPGGEGEKIKIEAVATKSSGQINSRWSPVSKAVFNNKIDPGIAEEKLAEFIKKEEAIKGALLSSKEKKVLINRFDINESERYFYTDENEEPNIFEFTIESIGVMKSLDILEKSLYIINTKISKFLFNLTKFVSSGENDFVSIEKSDTVMQAFDIKIINETHTLGNLIQTFTNLLSDSKLKFVGYFKPHPLNNHIILRVSVEDNNMKTLVQILQDSCKEIKKITTLLSEQLYSELGVEKKSMSIKTTGKKK